MLKKTLVPLDSSSHIVISAIAIVFGRQFDNMIGFFHVKVIVFPC